MRQRLQEEFGKERVVFLRLTGEPQLRLELVHELVHAVRIRRNAGSHLAVERAPALHLLLHHRAPARAEALLCVAQLRGLIGIEVELLLHAIVEPLLDLRPQAPCLGGVARRAHAVTLLGGETPPRPPREQDGKAE